jgi:hypothetical protein
LAQLAIIGLQAAGTAVSAMGTIAGGKAAQQAGQAGAQGKVFEAKQLEQAAMESRASQQRVAMERRREGTLLNSKLQARAAASGGGASDPTIVNLAEGIAGRSEYGALLEMYKGENRARGLEDQAVGSRMTADALIREGEMKNKAAKMSAIGTIIGGAGSMFNTASGGQRPVSYG